MDKKIIKGLIDEKLEAIQEQFSIIRAYEGKIPVIEIDLVMANIRDLYEIFMVLQQQNTGATPSAEPAVPHETVSRPEKETFPRKEPDSFSLPETEIVPEPEAERDIQLEPRPEPVEIPVPPPRRSPEILGFEPVVEPEPVVEKEPETQPHAEIPSRITFDLFSDGSSATLADKLKSHQDRRIADKLQDDHVMDMRSHIGINDKFLFINELYDGNMRIYDEAIQKLNDCTTLAQADLLLLDLKIVYNWDSESPTVKKFVELARKKFAQ
ncbi:MAG: procyclic acidic repetitive family protein [Bacteroidales bacterium]|nr:procyclic acidic repetitive family protein [Bacteroidales bacterium]